MKNVFQVVAVMLLAGWTAAAVSHALPQREEPAAGSVVEHSPDLVQIWFDAELEPGLCSLRVVDGHENQVSRGKAEVDPANPSLLKASVLPLPVGVYRVYWRVLSKDGHITQGDYRFTVRTK